jgi:Heat induced stress protein YflT domain
MNVQSTVTSLPLRRCVASFPTYAQAQRAVDYLSDEKFPVERVAIVGEGLRLVEQVTGRRTWGKAMVDGLLGGLITGLLLGWLFGAFNLVNPLVSAVTLAVWGLVVGAVIGIVAGILGYALTGGERDFTSVGSVQAEHYNIMVDTEVANEAERLLALRPAA